MSIIVAEIVGAIDAAGTTNTFYVSSDHFITSPTDTPAHTAFIAAIMEPGSIGLHTFSDGRTSGSSQLEVGEFILANADGSFDDWIDYSFDGRAITIRSGEVGGDYPADFTNVFVGTIDSVEATWDKIIIKLRDKQYVFDRPLLTTRYAGNNALPAGLEGTPDDIKDQVKPRVYGKCFNVTPRLVNTAKLTYQLSDGAINSIQFVYDKGDTITAGANHATSALLQAATPAAGTYETCLAEGYFRLGSQPQGSLTVDVTQGAAASDRTVAQIVKAIALAAGVASGDISSADVTAMDTANSSVVGIYIDDESTFQECIDELVNSIGAYSSFDSSGVLRMAVITAPSGTPVVSLQEYDMHETPERKVPKDNGIPVYRVTINHTRLFTTITDLDGAAITAAMQAYFGSEYRSTKSEDTSIKTQWLLASEISQDTLLTSASDAATEAARQLALYKVRRDIYEVGVQLDIFTANNLRMNDVIELVVPRFGMDSGKLFRLIGFNLELKTNTAILQVWG